ncbi:MAG TPA: hypothetical protein PKB02_13125 [Anaerohalosphaeraceae bacterium]|nr:hypothetical protein [Anaerohalosphaeraceae bacterium]
MLQEQIKIGNTSEEDAKNEVVTLNIQPDWNKSEQRCVDLLERIAGLDGACKFNLASIHLMLYHPNPCIKQLAHKCLSACLDYVFTPEGIESIGDNFGTDEVADIMNLFPLLNTAKAAIAVKQNECTLAKSQKTRDIVEYFQSLSIREKLLISVAAEIGALSSCIPGSLNEGLNSDIQDAIDVDPADVPNDPECQWLLGIQQLASTASR